MEKGTERNITGPEKYEPGLPYIELLQVASDLEHGPNRAPMSELFLNEVQREIDKIMENGGEVSGVLSAIVYDPEQKIDKPINLLQIVGSKEPGKVTVVLPDFESGDKTNKTQVRAKVNRSVSLLTDGVVTPVSQGKENTHSALRQEDWVNDASAFIESQDGMIIGAVEGRTMGTSAKIEVRKFILIK